MLALTGPTSTTAAPSGAMKRPSDVPPMVFSSGRRPAKPSQAPSRTALRSEPSGCGRARRERCQSTWKSSHAREQRLKLGSQPAALPVRVVAEVELRLRARPGITLFAPVPAAMLET
jgi:hypothetical protein